MIYVSPENWTPSIGINLEPNANDVVKSMGNILVTAGPGAGKTEMLAQKACFLLMTNKCKNPFKILAISFKKDSAENLKKRVATRCGELSKNRFTSITYDAFAKTILDQFRNSLPENIRPQSNYIILGEDSESKSVIREIFEKHGYSQTIYEKEDKYIKRLCNIANTFRINEIETNNQAIFDEMIKGSSERVPILTYSLIKQYATFIVESNSYIKNVIQQSYFHVFLDEFQDTTDLQYNLIISCFKGSNTVLTAVGDEKQKIMTWAGAMPNAFDTFVSDFSATKKYLIQNHRSAPKLVELQRAMYAALNASTDKVLSVDKWKSSDGRIILAEFDNDIHERNYIVQEIKKYIDNNVNQKDMCIICRNNPNDYTNGIILDLKKLGIHARLEADYMDLLKSPLITIFLSLIDYIDKPNADTRNSILEFLTKAKKIDLLDEKNYFDLINNLQQFVCRIKKIKDNVTDFLSLQGFVNEILEFIGTENIKQTFPEYTQGSILSRDSKKFVELFFKDLVNSNFNWSNAVDNFKGSHSIPIMTIHKSKGLEYKVVIFLGLEDQIFFGFKNRPEEEKCNFFVAISRAKTDLIFTYCKYRYDAKQYNERNHDNINEFYSMLTYSNLVEKIFYPIQ